MRDLVSNILTAVGDNGDSIDLRGADSVAVIGLTDPTARILVSDAAASGFAAPPAAELVAITGLGTVAVGYSGSKRYLQAGIADVVVRGNLHRAPAT
jgi:hypothetical protein